MEQYILGIKNFYHSDKDTEFGAHFGNVAVCEDESLLLLLLGGEYDGDLLGCHRQHRQLYSVKLVEAAPRARLS